MRRSQTPSIRRAAKLGISLGDVDVIENVSASEEMQWGTPGGFKGFRPRKYTEGENPLQDKRIFLVLWRKQSNKKHKTWTGNGTLEVTEHKATLKDETGKTLDTLTCFKREQIQENVLLEIGIRDVEVQIELKTSQECISQRLEEIENWYGLQEESIGMVSENSSSLGRAQWKPKILKKRKRSPDPELHNEVQDIVKKVPAPLIVNDYICMLSPAELQTETIQLLSNYCREMDQESSSEDLLEVVEQICDHPVLLKHMENQPTVAEALLPQLPPWQEMGLYDSAKFEFVHLILDQLVVAHGKKCAIVANSQNCLDIIRGYCQCWNIKHFQVEDNLQASCFHEPESNEASVSSVALLRTNQLPQAYLNGCKYFIFYNYAARLAAGHLVTDDSRLYTLVTASCLEELQFQQHLGLINSNFSIKDILDLNVNATHQLLEAVPKNLSSWNQWGPPYSEGFLKDTFFNEELANLKYVFSKQHSDTFEPF